MRPVPVEKTIAFAVQKNVSLARHLLFSILGITILLGKH